MGSHIPPKGERTENIIMIADDDYFARGLLKLAVQEMSTVVETEDSERVVELYKKYNPDVLLLDLHLPKMNGKKLLRDILSYDPDAFVVMVSADSNIENVLSATRLGAKGYVAKPFTKPGLMKYVMSCPTFTYSEQKKTH